MPGPSSFWNSTQKLSLREEVLINNAKINSVRFDGVYGMEKFTAKELHAKADAYENKSLIQIIPRSQMASTRGESYQKISRAKRKIKRT